MKVALARIEPPQPLSVSYGYNTGTMTTELFPSAFDSCIFKPCPQILVVDQAPGLYCCLAKNTSVSKSSHHWSRIILVIFINNFFILYQNLAHVEHWLTVTGTIKDFFH
ncbi:hypothetical protein Zmor_003977 [Zophobas morio]|uniref:Uncharacterized protein n=1 Tax=Zophobas morio TaxID=2755281 RepID=A0AA38HK82_9CUCU|nr:hypothetical protein Zmor_003977 [Zophobas morio]